MVLTYCSRSGVGNYLGPRATGVLVSCLELGQNAPHLLHATAHQNFLSSPILSTRPGQCPGGSRLVSWRPWGCGVVIHTPRAPARRTSTCCRGMWAAEYGSAPTQLGWGRDWDPGAGQGAGPGLGLQGPSPVLSLPCKPSPTHLPVPLSDTSPSPDPIPAKRRAEP